MVPRSKLVEGRPAVLLQGGPLAVKKVFDTKNPVWALLINSEGGEEKASTQVGKSDEN